MPEGAIYVGRPSPWGNPYDLNKLYSMPSGWRKLTPEEAVHLFRLMLTGRPTDYYPIRGHDLACWCPLNQPCHADVLLELANR